MYKIAYSTAERKNSKLDRALKILKLFPRSKKEEDRNGRFRMLALYKKFIRRGVVVLRLFSNDREPTNKRNDQELNGSIKAVLT